MPELVDHLAQLTAFRDREALDVTLASALHEVLHPLSVAILRKIGEPGDERWSMRARLGIGEVAATSDSAWIDVDSELAMLLDESASEAAGTRGASSTVMCCG